MRPPASSALRFSSTPRSPRLTTTTRPGACNAASTSAAHARQGWGEPPSPAARGGVLHLCPRTHLRPPLLVEQLRRVQPGSWRSSSGAADHYIAPPTPIPRRSCSFTTTSYLSWASAPAHYPGGRAPTGSPQLVDELPRGHRRPGRCLAACGVNVLPMTGVSKDVDIRSTYWNARRHPPLNVRDQTVILGSTIVETAPHVRARMFENDLLKPLFYRYYQLGGELAGHAAFALTGTSLDAGYFTRQGLDVTSPPTARGPARSRAWAWRWSSTARNASGWAAMSWSTWPTTTTSSLSAGFKTTCLNCASTVCTPWPTATSTASWSRCVPA